MKKLKNIIIKMLIAPPLFFLIILFGLLALFGNKTVLNYYNTLFCSNLSSDEFSEEMDRIIHFMRNVAILFWIFVLYIIVFQL
jgi:hypothetical protein